LPDERGLPLAFLSCTVGDIISTPFRELSATRGVGRKKIESLVDLLCRAAREESTLPLPVRSGRVHGAQGEEATEPNDEDNGFEATRVSESVWAKWRETVLKFGLEHEKLGRLASSLQALPTVIWDTPLSHFAHHTLSEIRRLPTYGRKRVRAVLEVFHAVDRCLADVADTGFLAVRLFPAFVPPLERWIDEVLNRSDPPPVDEIRDRLAVPLINQIRVDVGETEYQLITKRLGIHGPPISVRTQSQQMGITRARVYQLLEHCQRVMQIRWPEGRSRLSELNARFSKPMGNRPVRPVDLLGTTRVLFFPERPQREPWERPGRRPKPR
jgi:hypothetical protein